MRHKSEFTRPLIGGPREVDDGMREMGLTGELMLCATQLGMVPAAKAHEPKQGERWEVPENLLVDIRSEIEYSGQFKAVNINTNPSNDDPLDELVVKTEIVYRELLIRDKQLRAAKRRIAELEDARELVLQGYYGAFQSREALAEDKRIADRALD